MAIRVYVPDAVATILDAQWAEMQTRQHVINNIRDMIIPMRHDLNDADISTPQRPVFSDVSSTCSDSVQSNSTVESGPDFTAFEEVASPPVCPLPSREGYNKGYFPWQAPPSHWDVPEQKVFFHIRPSDVLRKLWRTYAAVNNLHAWTALNIATNCTHKNPRTDSKSFLTESHALFLHLSASDNEYTYRALTGGWEESFEKSPKVAWCVGTNQVTTPSGTTSFRDCLVCTVFGAACLSRDELLAATVQSGRCILFHPMIVKNTARVEWFTFFDKQLSLPNPDTPIRISALYKRGHCRLMNAWFDRYESRRKCTVLASMTSFQFKQLLPSESSRVQDEGMWELCLLENSPAERFDSLDTTAIRQQLSWLTRTKKHHLRYPKVPFVFQDRSTHHQRESALKRLCETWDSPAEQRQLFLKRKRIPWDDVDKNLQAANKLLLQCPFPRLARIARLASIPIGRSLRSAGILIHAVIRRYAPYVGQLGEKTRRQRTPLSRLHEPSEGQNIYSTISPDNAVDICVLPASWEPVCPWHEFWRGLGVTKHPFYPFNKQQL